MNSEYITWNCTTVKQILAWIQQSSLATVYEKWVIYFESTSNTKYYTGVTVKSEY